jgi:hypothetical protein
MCNDVVLHKYFRLLLSIAPYLGCHKSNNNRQRKTTRLKTHGCFIQIVVAYNSRNTSVFFYENSNAGENSSYSCGLTSGAPQLFSGKPTPRNMLKQLMYFYNTGAHLSIISVVKVFFIKLCSHQLDHSC